MDINLKSSNRFSFGVALTLGARILMAANSVLAGVIVARLLGAESLGILVVLNATISIVIQLAAFGIPAANTYFTARDRDTLISAASNAVVFALLSGPFAGAAVWIFSPYFLPGVPPHLAAIGLLGVAFQLVTIILINLFLAQNEVKRFNFLDLFNQSFVLINAVVALLLFSGGLFLLVCLNTAASFAVSLLTTFLVYRYISAQFPSARWRVSFDLFRRMIGYAFKGHVLWVFTFLAYRIDLLIVNYFRGPAEASVYAVASQCTLFLMLLPHSVAHLLQTRVASTQDDGGNFTCSVTRHTSLLLAAACIISVPGALFVPYLYGAGFDDLHVQLWLLLPGVFFVGVQSVLVQYFVGTGLPWKLPAYWGITLLVNIILDVLVVPIYGARGAAVISTLCYTTAFALVYMLFRKVTRQKLSDVLLPSIKEITHLPNIITSQKIIISR